MTLSTFSWRTFLNFFSKSPKPTHHCTYCGSTKHLKLIHITYKTGITHLAFHVCRTCKKQHSL